MVDLTKIHGTDVGTPPVILAEIGVDVSRFPTEKHLQVSCVCVPRRTVRATRQGAAVTARKNRITTLCGWPLQSAGRTMTPLGMFYRRIHSQIGGLGAVKATYKIACLGLQNAQVWPGIRDQSMEEYEAKMKAAIS